MQKSRQRIDLGLIKSIQQMNLWQQRAVWTADDLQVCQLSYILKVLETTVINFWRLSDEGNCPKELSCGIQQSVLKKVTNY